MIVLDASVVIAYLEPDDALHDRATSLLVDLIADGPRELVLNPLTAAEVLAGFVPGGREQAAWRDMADVGFTIRGLPDDATGALLLARTRRSSGLKMPDAVVLATALHWQGEVATFDDSLRRAAGDRGVLLERQR